jgi:site-specific DNA-cytosine methylase
MVQKQIKMNILSLFDGMSCGQIALNKAGIKYDNYYSSEIDKHAIKVTQSNYPKTIQLGGVTRWKEWDLDWSKIGLLMGGPPCQGFSFSGKQLAFNDPRSALFFVFVEIWRHIKSQNPNAYYLLENVKMKKEHELVISNYMGVHPIEINSALISAQNRKRLYWTNISNEPYGFFGDMQCVIPQPKDKGILLKDVLESEVDEKYYLSDKMVKCLSNRGQISKGYEFKPSFGNQKANCILTKEGQYSTCNFILKKEKIRRLTPIECERLQTAPDEYTKGVSDTQRYRMLGNGWTVDVITHILKYIK